MRKERIVVIVEVGLSVALAAVLGMISVRLPINFAGGKVALEMLPIMVLALRRGVLAGVIAGALFGFVDLMIEPFIVHPVQLVLDYPLAFAAVGLAGVGHKAWKATFSQGEVAKATGIAAAACLFGAAARLLSHFVSGVVFFASDAPAGQPVVLYSLIYNASYMVPSTIACVIAAVIVLPALERAVPTTVAPGTPQAA